MSVTRPTLRFLPGADELLLDELDELDPLDAPGELLELLEELLELLPHAASASATTRLIAASPHHLMRTFTALPFARRKTQRYRPLTTTHIKPG